MRTARVVAAVVETDFAVPLVAGLLGDHVDRAADGIATEVRALRTAQHFDALEVDDLRIAGAGHDVELVDVERVGRGPHVGVLVQLVADTAHAQVFAVARAVAAEAHVRRQREVILDTLHVGVAQRLLADRGDRDRHVLDGLRASLRGNDDFIDSCAAGCSFLGLRGRGEQAQCRSGHGPET